MSLIRSNVNSKYIEELKRGKRHTKICHYYKNDGIFNIPEGCKVLLMSDIHSITTVVVDDLIKKNTINDKTIVITTGDMSGDFSTAGNGDPFEDYVKINKAAKAFYFVQGNHDYRNSQCKKLTNDDGTKCYVEGILQDTILGKITGLNGIIVDDARVNKKLHKYSQEEYNRKLDYLLNLKPDIFLTHMPLDKERLESVFLPKIHLCGHYDTEDYFVNDMDYCMINLDGKIVELIS